MIHTFLKISIGSNCIYNMKIFVERRTYKRYERWISITNKYIQNYIKTGSKGDLIVLGSPIIQLPDNLTIVGGKLDLEGTAIEYIPDNLFIIGSLDLRGTPIKKLPDNLLVNGIMDITGCDVVNVPNNLKVYGLYFDISYTMIEKLPRDLIVSGDLYCRNTPLGENYMISEIRRMCPNIRGEILK